MELQPENVVHVLSFKTPGLGSNAVMHVCSPHIAMIEKFISIHLEKDALNHINSYAPQDLPVEIMKDITNNILKYYKFRNNEDNHVYSIPTNRNIIEEATHYVCNELSYHCEFGDIITQTDIPIMDILNKLIGGLDYAVVLDTQKVNNDIDNNVDHTDYIKNSMSNQFTKNPGELDDSYIYNELMTDSLETGDDIMPFTANGYVSGFTQLLFDPREWG